MTTNPPAIVPATVAKTTLTYDASVAVVLGTKAAAARTSAVEIIIDSDDMLELAGEELRRIKGLQKDVEEKRTSITGPLNQAVTAINALFKNPKTLLEEAESTLKRAISTYQVEAERKAALARKQAEEAAAAERERLAAIEAEQLAAAATAEQEAQVAIENGDQAGAEEAAAVAHIATMNAAAAQVSSAVLAVAPKSIAAGKVSGLSGRTNYVPEVLELMDLVKAVAEGKAPIEALAADMTFLRAQAKAFKKAGALYPGVNVKAERTVSARAA